MAFGGLVKDSVAIYLVSKVARGGRKRPVRSVEEQGDLGRELLWVYFVLIPWAVFVLFPRWVKARWVELRAWSVKAKKDSIEWVRA
jgi:hypothetical protein